MSAVIADRDDDPLEQAVDLGARARGRSRRRRGAPLRTSAAPPSVSTVSGSAKRASDRPDERVERGRSTAAAPSAAPAPSSVKPREQLARAAAARRRRAAAPPAPAARPCRAAGRCEALARGGGSGGAGAHPRNSPGSRGGPSRRSVRLPNQDQGSMADPSPSPATPPSGAQGSLRRPAVPRPGARRRSAAGRDRGSATCSSAAAPAASRAFARSCESSSRSSARRSRCTSSIACGPRSPDSAVRDLRRRRALGARSPGSSAAHAEGAGDPDRLPRRSCLIPIGVGAILIPPLVQAAADLVGDFPVYVDDLKGTVNENETLQGLNDDFDVTSQARGVRRRRRLQAHRRPRRRSPTSAPGSSARSSPG